MKKTVITNVIVGILLFSIIGINPSLGVSCSETKLYVSESGDYFDIQDAIDNANEGDIIIVKDGVYPGRIDFLGKAIRVMSENGSSNCIIDGNDIKFGVKFNNNESSSSVLQGFTIRNCKAENSHGGGIYCGVNTSPMIINCIITGNSAEGKYGASEGSGGGIFCDRFSSPTFISCKITNNWAIGDISHYAYGGGICGYYSSPKLFGCLISNNYATYKGGSGGQANGGGLYFAYGLSYPVLKSCIIVNNIADTSGGGIAVKYGVNVTINGCTFSRNQAHAFPSSCVSKLGGAISCSDSEITVRNTILWDDFPNEIFIKNEYDLTKMDINFSDIKNGQEGIYIQDTGNIEENSEILNYGSMNINSNPDFKNPEYDDFHIKITSSCVDSGGSSLDLDNWEYDFDRESRIYDIPEITIPEKGPVDIGADEINPGKSKLIEVELTSNLGKLCMIISNNGDDEIKNVNWRIFVTGGIFNKMDVTEIGDIDTIQPHTEEIVYIKRSAMSGIGRIEATAIVSSQDSNSLDTDKANGFIVPFFVKIIS